MLFIYLSQGTKSEKLIDLENLMTQPCRNFEAFLNYTLFQYVIPFRMLFYHSPILRVWNIQKDIPV